MVITIVGSGASALSLLYNFLEHIPSDDTGAVTVYLVEKRGTFGPGAAYTDDVVSNLLNTKTGYITPFYDIPGDFLSWLHENQKLWKRSFPTYQIDADGYAPRPLFGLYMQQRMAWLVKQALKKNVCIIQVDAEAEDLVKVGNSYITKTNCSLSLASDYVFLCCGTLPKKRPRYAQSSDRILPTPYPISELARTIPPDASVGIAGARLSCIDAVIGLVEGGHTGPLTIHSRSGYFPSIRGTQGRISPRLLTSEQIDMLVKLKGKLSLRDIVQLVLQEISLVSGEVVRLPSLPPAPPSVLQAYLIEEIDLAAEPRAWQAVLYCTNSIIDKLWNALADQDKAELLSKYFSAFMAYRVSIPMENGKKILSYLQQGQLSYVAGQFDVVTTDEGKPRVTVHEEKDRQQYSVEYDYLINATGSPRSVEQLDSKLVANLLAKGIIVPHKFGGVAIDPDNYAAINSLGVPDQRLFVLGELTVGTFFFISALDINARHARNCALAFVDAMSSGNDLHTERIARHG